jgi:DNA-binding NarL/FixJ family response regulator
MPNMDGRETYAAIRAIDPDAIVLLCSGYSEDEYAGELMADGAAGFVPKPFTVAELSRRVRDALGRADAPGER